jgi:hypothetical protein
MHTIHEQPCRAADERDSETGEEQVDVLEHDWAGEPAEHSIGDVLQPKTLQPDEGMLLKPRYEDNHPDKDIIGVKVNQLTDSTNFFINCIRLKYNNIQF